MRDLHCHMKRVRLTLEKKPRPQSGADLMKAYARHHFKNCPAGGSGRVVQLNNVRGLLRHAIKVFAYDPVVTCQANYRQAPYDMKCWSEKLGKEITIGEFVEAIKSGRVTR